MERGDAELPLVHVGRQPIYDRSGDVVAYELLFRDAVEATQASRRSADATSRVIVAAFTDFGLEELVGGRACFINVTREFLVGELPIPFDSDQTVLEVIETVDVDDAVVEGVKELVGRGFTIALDDYLPGAHDRLLPLATYVKVDVLRAEADVIDGIVRRCQEDFPNVQLIAERLETEEQLHRAFDLGFHLFQGHVLGRPHVVSMVELSPARLGRVRLVAALAAAEVDFDEVVSLVASDPALTYRLLQATNSAASGVRTRVSSVHEAAVLLGLPTIRQWVTLMVLGGLTEGAENQLAVTLTRARMCQTVAQRIGLSGDAAFSVGLLSGVAELIGQSPAEVVRQLPLSEETSAALAERAGGLGHILTAVRDYENGDAAGLAGLLDSDGAVNAYLTAMKWCHEVMSTAGPVGQSRPSPASA
ncbi:EAL and HDOD domain-containing protein [Actinoplanes sp. NPDC049599]|uniref:EAL and HDOD domain-containing protein n=1 Tax=Actinoplanes sp. NPDC049599 TaxID=3363903 RepID=UPI0037BCA1D3